MTPMIETILIAAAILCLAYLLTHTNDKPLPYTWCTTHIDQALTEYGYCPVCKKCYDYGRVR